MKIRKRVSDRTEFLRISLFTDLNQELWQSTTAAIKRRKENQRKDHEEKDAYGKRKFRN